jgi:hypothetical protein
MPLSPGDAKRRVDLRDLASGLGLLVIAGLFALGVVTKLSIGTPSAMGPGFFPLMAAGALAVTALLITIRAFGRPTVAIGFAGPRVLACILCAPVLFAVGVAPFGFVPTIAVTTLLATWGSRLMTLRFALAVTAGLTLLCTIVFIQLLRIPVRLVGPWLGG